MELNKLRFLDENNEPYPDWEEKRLGDLGKIVGGGTPSTAIEDYWDGDIDWYSPAEIKSKYAISSVKKITEKGLKNSSAKLIPAGTVIVTTRATLGKMSILTKAGTTNQGFQSVVTGSSLLNEFLYYGQPKIEKYCIEKAGGSTFKEISKTEFSKYPLPLPSLPEQEKIASFFSLLDERIEAYSALLDLSREEKKAYSQRLFSQTLRFTQDDGSPYPDWEEKRLGDICSKISSSLSVSSLDIEQEAGAVPIYSASGISGFKNIPNPINENYVLVIKDGAGVGRTTKAKKGTRFINTLQGILPNENTTVDYLHQLIGQMNLGENYVGTTIPHIYFKDYSQERINLPSLPEQEKIASFLSALDDRIENLTLKLEALKQEKKAYSQRMFG